MEKSKTYYWMNREKILKQKKLWRLKNKEYSQKYREEHKEEAKVYSKWYYKAHKAELGALANERTKKYYKEHREEILLKMKIKRSKK